MTLPLRRFAAAGLAAALSLLLSACLVSPGKFTSSLDLRKDGQFSYSYSGEVFLLGLSRLAEMAAKEGADAKFDPTACTNDDQEMSQRECTEDELRAQRATWEEEQKAAASKRVKDAEMMKAMLGGIDPSSPQAAEELAERLRRQAGWKSVVYKGEGVFQVDFKVAGRLDHDFVFPTIERMPMANTFVVLSRRADGSVRMNAPGFGTSEGGGGMGSFAQFAAMGAAMSSKEEGEDTDMPALPLPEGTFTLTTDGTILANNTDEGPETEATGKRLVWTVNARATQAPTALVQLGN